MVSFAARRRMILVVYKYVFQPAEPYSTHTKIFRYGYRGKNVRNDPSKSKLVKNGTTINEK
jgi:hypothetical protein